VNGLLAFRLMWESVVTPTSFIMSEAYLRTASLSVTDQSAPTEVNPDALS
jgi:hypothetical protein